jgi:iron complex transport system substrate-binding protein
MNGRPTPRRPAAWRSLLTLVLVCMLALACTLALTGCGSGDEGPTTSSAETGSTLSTPLPTDASGAVVPGQAKFPVTLTDDNGNSATIEAKPMRIVSAAPVNTEILFALGVGDRVVGVNALDDYPPEVAGIAKVGDYVVNSEAVMALSPDLVLASSGAEEGLAPVQQAGAPVLIFNPTSLQGIYANIVTIGAATGATVQAADLINGLRASIQEISDAVRDTGEPPSVFYAVDNTLWTCGPGSVEDELLGLANATNVGASAELEGVTPAAYYQLSPEQLVAADPDLILLPTSAFASAAAFTADPRFAGLTAVKLGHVYAIDDKTIGRHGPRIALGLRTLVEAIHPGVL